MAKINCKSDFKLTLGMRQGDEPAPFPDCDREAEFWTGNRTRKYRASCIGGECGLRVWKLLENRDEASAKGYQHVFSIMKFRELPRCAETLARIAPDIYDRCRRIALGYPMDFDPEPGSSPRAEAQEGGQA